MNCENVITDYGIKKLRQALYAICILAEWTEEDLAKLLGVTRQTVSKIMNREMTRRDALAILYLIGEKIRSDALTGNDDLLYGMEYLVYPYLHREKPLDISKEDKFSQVMYRTYFIANKFSKKDLDLTKKRRKMMRTCIHDIYTDKTI